MQHATPAVIILIVLFMGPLLYYIRRAIDGREMLIRRIPGIDAIDEAIGRSVEMGRPLSFTTGITRLSPTLYACLGSLHYVARKAAVFGSRLLVPCSDPEALVISDATLQNAYRQEKKFSRYNPTMLRFLSEEQFAYASGYQGLIHRENVGAAFMFGHFAAESLILAESGQQVGAMQVAASASPEQVPFFLTACDYTLIGEELYAAGAYLSRDPVQVGSLRGQDIMKCVVLLIVMLGIFQATYFSFVDGSADAPVKDWMNSSWQDLFGDEQPVTPPVGG